MPKRKYNWTLIIAAATATLAVAGAWWATAYASGSISARVSACESTGARIEAEQDRHEDIIRGQYLQLLNEHARTRALIEAHREDHATETANKKNETNPLDPGSDTAGADTGVGLYRPPWWRWWPGYLN